MMNWKMLSMTLLGLTLVACDGKKEEKKSGEVTPPEAAKVEEPKTSPTMPMETPKEDSKKEEPELKKEEPKAS